MPDGPWSRGSNLRPCFIAWSFDCDMASAQTLVREVLTLAPGLPNAHELLGATLLGARQFGKGVASLEHAYALDPFSDFMLYNFAMSLIFAGEATRAIDLLRPALVRSSGNGGLYLLLCAALFSMDRLSEARIALERGRELIPAGPQYHEGAR